MELSDIGTLMLYFLSQKMFGTNHNFTILPACQINLQILHAPASLSIYKKLVRASARSRINVARTIVSYPPLSVAESDAVRSLQLRAKKSNK